MPSATLIVTTGNDDADETAAGVVATGGTTHQSDATNEWIALRFSAGNPVPPGATMVAARLQLVPTNNNNDEPKHTIYFEKVADSAAIGATAFGLSTRTRTAGTLWDVPDLGQDATGASYFDSVDLANRFQEIIDLPGYTAGGAIVALLHGDADANRDLTIKSAANTAGAFTPKLYLEWTESGGTTEVTATRTLLWDVRQEVSAARAISWSVRQRVQATRAASWSARQRIAATRDLLWSVHQRVTADRDIAWSVRELVAVSRAVLFDVQSALTQVIATRTVSWGVRQRIAATRAVAWHVRARVAAGRVLRWNDRQRVTTARSLSWDVRAAVGVSRALSWGVHGRVALTRILRWNVASDLVDRAATVAIGDEVLTTIALADVVLTTITLADAVLTTITLGDRSSE